MGNETRLRTPVTDGTRPGVVTPESIREFLVQENFLVYATAPTLQFSDWLASELQRRRISQRQLGFSSGVDHSSISRLLDEKTEPGARTFAALAQGLRLSEVEQYDVAILSIPQQKRWERRSRLVFHEEAPALEGSFGQQLRGYRIARGFSLRGIAVRTNEHYANLSKVETMSRAPMFRQYAGMVFEYGINPRQNASLLAAALPVV